MKKKNDKHAKPRRAVQNRGNAAEEESLSLLCKSVGKGLLATFFAGGFLLLIFSLIAYFGGDPSAWIRPAGIAAAAAAVTVGGFVSARSHRHAALLCGLLHGGTALGLMFLFSLFFPALRSGDAGWLAALIRLAVPLLSVAGGYFGIRKKPQKKAAKRRR